MSPGGTVPLLCPGCGETTWADVFVYATPQTATLGTGQIGRVSSYVQCRLCGTTALPGEDLPVGHDVDTDEYICRSHEFSQSDEPPELPEGIPRLHWALLKAMREMTNIEDQNRLQGVTGVLFIIGFVAAFGAALPFVDLFEKNAGLGLAVVGVAVAVIFSSVYALHRKLVARAVRDISTPFVANCLDRNGAGFQSLVASAQIMKGFGIGRVRKLIERNSDHYMAACNKRSKDTEQKPEPAG